MIQYNQKKNYKCILEVLNVKIEVLNGKNKKMP